MCCPVAAAVGAIPRFATRRCAQPTPRREWYDGRRQNRQRLSDRFSSICPRMTFTIGIDVGGTFTDIVVSGPGGGTVIAKAATTPADQSGGVLVGIALAAERLGLTAADLLRGTSRIVHGTTVATNALLEGKTARAGMLTTAGHRDVIEMREGLKPDRYNLRMAPPAPLVPRRLRLPVTERIRANGSVEVPLDPGSLNA